MRRWGGSVGALGEGHRRLWAAGFALGVSLLLGCGGDTHRLLVDVRSDMVPGIDFDRVVVALPTIDGARSENEVGSLAWHEGVRVGDFPLNRTGNVPIDVVAYRGGRVVLSRHTVANVRGAMTGAFVVLSRACRDVMCPGEGDSASATSCLGGRCVPEGCVRGDEPVCGGPMCTRDTDCPAPTASCARGACADATCLILPNASSPCAPGLVCVPETGCTPIPGRDAGVEDGGTDADVPGCPPVCELGTCDPAVGACVLSSGLQQPPENGEPDERRGFSVHRFGMFEMSGKPGYAGTPVGTAPDGGSAHISRNRLRRRFLNGEANLLCGIAVQVTATHVVLGCPGIGNGGLVLGNAILGDDLSGSVAQIQPPLPADSDFGAALAHEGGDVYIGDPVAGSVWLWRDPDVSVRWSEPSLPGFGRAIAAAGRRVLVAHDGGAILYDAASGAELDRMTAAGVQSVALSATHGAVGQPGSAQVQLLDDVSGGSASPGRVLIRPGVDGFGHALSMDGSRLLVGAPGAVVGGASRGAAILFRISATAEQVAWLVPAAATAGARVGEAVHLDAEGAMIGAPGHATTGAVWFVDF